METEEYRNDDHSARQRTHSQSHPVDRRRTQVRTRKIANQTDRGSRPQVQSVALGGRIPCPTFPLGRMKLKGVRSFDLTDFFLSSQTE